MGREMGRGLTAYEILEIAEQMERNAARFYRRAAALCEDPKVGKLLTELAQWESRHVQVFTEMREQLSARAWELGHREPDHVGCPPPVPTPPVFGERADPSRELTGRENKADVFALAIRKQEYLIAYYTGLKEFVLGKSNIRVLKDIIREENRHLRILADSLARISRQWPGEP
jgi:rubrerythrin